MKGELFKKVAALLCAAAVSGWSYTLKEAMLHTLDTNPVLQERIKNYNATLQDVEIAKSGWLPKVDYSGNVGFESANNLNSGYDWSDYTLYENSLVLTQNIFSGWSTTHRIETQKARLLAAAYSYVESVQDVGYNLTRYYLEVIKNRELLKIAEENIRINEEIFNKVNKLYNSGLTTKSEMEKAAASLALARSNRVVQRNNLQDAVYQYKYYFGKKVDPARLEEPDLNLPLPKSYREGVDFALKNNPSLLVQRYNIRVAQEDYKEKFSGYYPKLDFRASWSWNRNTNGANYGRDDRARVGLWATYNLFNGFADSAAIQKGVSNIRREVMTRDDMQRKTEESFDLSWSAYKNLKEKLANLQEYKLHAVRTLRLYSKEYEMGRRSLLDLLSAQSDLINAKSQIAATKYDYLFSKFRILDAMGIMVPAVVGRAQIYRERVALVPEAEVEKDSLPADILERNDRFLQTLEKRRTGKVVSK